MVQALRNNSMLPLPKYIFIKFHQSPKQTFWEPTKTIPPNLIGKMSRKMVRSSEEQSGCLPNIHKEFLNYGISDSIVLAERKTNQDRVSSMANI